MSYPVYYVPAGDVLPVLFDSFDGGTGGAITMTWLAVTDIEIYKDGGITQRASDAGYILLDTDGIDFDGITGIHGFSIDTGDNTDAGFYTVGAWFHVVISAITIDAQTVNFIACAFRIMAAEGVAAVPDVNLTHVADVAVSTTTAHLGVNVVQISADATAADNAESFFDGTGYAGTGNTIPTVTTLTNANPTAAAVADAVWDEDATAHQTLGSYGQAIGDPVADTNTIYKAVVTDATGATVGVDVVAVKADTAAIGVAGAGLTDLGGMSTTMKAQVETEVDDALGGGTGTALTAIPWNAAWDAEVQSEAEDALVTHRVDELLNADSDIDGLAPPTVGSVFHELMSKTAGSFTFDQTTDSNEAIRDKETDIETDTTEIGAAGAGLTAINLPDQTMNITGDITGSLSGSVGS